MRKRQLEKYRKQLLELRREILREIRHDLKEEREGQAAEGRDTYDIASDERDREINLLLTDRERKKLLLVDDALQRVDSGEYGVCDECGEDIAPGRLEAMPFTRLCVTCQGEFEQAQRTMQAEAVPTVATGRMSAADTDEEAG